MTLDPELAEMITLARAAAGRGIHTLPVAEARTAYRERYLARGVSAGAAANAETLSIVRADGSTLSARLYRPDRPAGAAPLPLLVYFHGGGYVVGDAAAYENQSAALAARSGAAVLVPDYRLAPEHRFPAAVEDAETAYRWACRHAAQLKCDPRRIGLGGDSAGGALALVAALAGRDAGPPASFLLLLYPLADFRPYCDEGPAYESVARFSDGYFLDRATMEWFAEQYLPTPRAARDPRASPLLWPNLAGLPPSAIVVAACDPLCSMGAMLAETMIRAGCRVQSRCMPGMIHNFMGYAGKSRAALAAFEQVTDLVQANL